MQAFQMRPLSFSWVINTALLVALLVVPAMAKADRIVVFGATGNLGQKIVREALNRGHEVVGVSRSPENFSYGEENFVGLAGNPTSAESVKEVTRDADVVVNAVGGRVVTSVEETAMYQSALAITEALGDLGEAGPYLLVIAGGSTMAQSREELIANMPAGHTEGSTGRALYLGHWAAYETYLASNLNWTVVTPPFQFIGWREGTGTDVRTGKYRTSTVGRVFDEEGKNSLTASDLAVAVVDFAERREPLRVKVALGY